MKRLLILILTVVLYSFAKAQDVPVIKFKELKEIIDRKTDTVYVVNFWATWCDPCVRELPWFLQLEKESAGKKVKFYFISLDFVKDYQSQFLPFLEKHSMHNYVYLLDEPDYNSWIDKVNSKWQGSVPCTIIISHHPDSIFFNEAEMSYESLSKIVNPLIH